MTAKRIWGYKDAELKRMWNNGVEIKEIARVLEVPHSAVDKRRKKLNLTPRKGSCVGEKPRANAWTASEDIIVRREWKLGTPVKTITAMLPGRSESAVFNRTETLNLKPRKQQGRVARQTHVFLSAKLQDELSKRAAKRGVTRSTYLSLVFTHFVEGGFELPRFMISTNTRPGSWRHMAALHAEKGHGRKDTIDWLVLHGASLNVAGNAVRWLDDNGWVWPRSAAMIAAE